MPVRPPTPAAGRVLPRIRTTLSRMATLFGVVQTVTIVALQVVAWLRKRRQGPVSFPRTPPEEFTTDEGTATIFMYGGDLYDDMLAAIRAAEREIYFETFIWKGDRLGQEFKDAFLDAAQRGVEVYLVWDKFANLVVDPEFFRFPSTVHVREHPLYQHWPRGWRMGKFARNHRKVLVVDGEAAWVGGYNIGSLYVNDWRDTHARLTGPIAEDLADAFVDYWNNLGGPRQRKLREPQGRTWHTASRVVRNVPAFASYPIRGMYLEAIDRASQRVWLTQAYLIPDKDLLEALLRAAGRGVDVHVIIPAEPRRSRRAVPVFLPPAAARRCPPVPLPGRDGACQDRDDRRAVGHDRDGEPGPFEPDGQLRDQRGVHRRRRGATDGDGVRHRPDQLPRAHPAAVAGPPADGEVLRGTAAPAQAAALK